MERDVDAEEQFACALERAGARVDRARGVPWTHVHYFHETVEHTPTAALLAQLLHNYAEHTARGMSVGWEAKQIDVLRCEDDIVILRMRTHDCGRCVRCILALNPR